MGVHHTGNENFPDETPTHICLRFFISKHAATDYVLFQPIRTVLSTKNFAKRSLARLRLNSKNISIAIFLGFQTYSQYAMRVKLMQIQSISVTLRNPSFFYVASVTFDVIEHKRSSKILSNMRKRFIS